jgi:drug/metabolite transporter (DMT)-like permease
MWFLILAGVVALLGGVLFLFSPKTLQQLSSKVNTAINKLSVPIDEKVYKMRLGVGVSLLLVAGMLFFVAYYLTRKYSL